MDRNASSAFLQQLERNQNAPIHLIEAYFDSGTIYVTDAHRNVEWNGSTYLANGHFLSFSPIEETAEINVHEVNAHYTGVDQTWISLFLNENYIDRRVIIRKAFIAGLDTDPLLTEAGAFLQTEAGEEIMLDAAYTVVDPIPIFDGRMDAPTIEEDPGEGSATVSLRASSSFSDFERRSGRRTNHEDQQIHFAGDNFFEFVADLNRDILWGVGTGGVGGISSGASGNDDAPMNWSD